jgi:hypothetical protein
MNRATITTAHGDAATIAAALGPDNTDEMATTVEDGHVVTRIERETTAGVQSTADDYLVNLQVATAVAAAGQTHIHDNE